MPQDYKSDLEDFRALQEDLLSLTRDFGRARLAAWAEEVRAMSDYWTAFSRQWEGSLEEMAALAAVKFQELGAQGQAAGSQVSQAWQRTFMDLTGAVDDWSQHLLEVLARVAAAWGEVPGGGGDWPGWLGGLLGGWFHQGGIVAGHQGLALSGDEQLVLAQAGEGILPRESMTRLGEKNFEALRTGQFEVAPAPGPASYAITIQVQSLDAQGVAGLDWDRVVKRHLLPALDRELGRRW
jgi:hypothetical protein